MAINDPSGGDSHDHPHDPRMDEPSAIPPNMSAGQIRIMKEVREMPTHGERLTAALQLTRLEVDAELIFHFASALKLQMTPEIEEAFLVKLAAQCAAVRAHYGLSEENELL